MLYKLLAYKHISCTQDAVLQGTIDEGSFATAILAPAKGSI